MGSFVLMWTMVSKTSITHSNRFFGRREFDQLGGAVLTKDLAAIEKKT